MSYNSLDVFNDIQIHDIPDELEDSIHEALADSVRVFRKPGSMPIQFTDKRYAAFIKKLRKQLEALPWSKGVAYFPMGQGSNNKHVDTFYVYQGVEDTVAVCVSPAFWRYYVNE